MVQQSWERVPRDKADGDAAKAAAAERLARWTAAIQARRPLLRRLGLAFSLLIISVSTVIFARTLLRIDMREVQGRLRRDRRRPDRHGLRPPALSYLALTGYDALALRHLRDPRALSADRARLVHELRGLLHARLSARHRRRGALLDLRPGGTVGRQGREPYRRRRHHLLARHGLHRRASASSSTPSAIGDINHFNASGQPGDRPAR